MDPNCMGSGIRSWSIALADGWEGPIQNVVRALNPIKSTLLLGAGETPSWALRFRESTVLSLPDYTFHQQQSMATTSTP